MGRVRAGSKYCGFNILTRPTRLKYVSFHGTIGLVISGTCMIYSKIILPSDSLARTYKTLNTDDGRDR